MPLVMTARIVALRVPSEGLFALLFPTQRKLQEVRNRADTQDDFSAALLKDPHIYKELLRLAKAIRPLARPLAQAKDATELEHVLVHQLPAYRIWKGELFTLVLEILMKMDSAKFLDSYANVGPQIQQFFQEKAARYLDVENAERLLFAASGVCLYSENSMRTILEEGSKALDLEVINATIQDFVKADLLILTAGLMLEREVRSWNKATLVLIAQKAEELINTVEDELLSRDPELRKRLAQPPGSSVSLEECRKQLGL